MPFLSSFSVDPGVFRVAAVSPRVSLCLPFPVGSQKGGRREALGLGIVSVSGSVCASVSVDMIHVKDYEVHA